MKDMKKYSQPIFEIVNLNGTDIILASDLKNGYDETVDFGNLQSFLGGD